jgi:hypothetical protein
MRGADCGMPAAAAVCALARISSPPARAAIRAAPCTPRPRKLLSTRCASAAWTDAYADRRREAVVGSVLGETALNGDRARERCFRISERDEEAIAGAVDLLAAVFDEHLAERAVVPGDEGAPRFIAERAGQRGRFDHVREQERLPCSSHHRSGTASAQRAECRGRHRDGRRPLALRRLETQEPAAQRLQA